VSNIKDGASYAPSANIDAVVKPGEFKFAAAFLDHGHILGQCNGLCDAGAQLTKVYEPDPDRLRWFLERFPNAQPVSDFQSILDDPNVQLVASAAIPHKRAEIGMAVLHSGKDYFTDKSPFTTLEQLNAVRLAVKETKQKYLVYYAERLHNDAAWIAGDLISEGVIGRVIQVVNLAPHRLAAATRPGWFFQKDYYGGILTDIGSHQVEQFLTYSGCSNATVNFARVENFSNPSYPEFEDFGEVSLTGDNGASFYSRVDWYTPEGLPTWGDGRTFIVGTQGTLELRKYIDPARKAPASLIIQVDGEKVFEREYLGSSGFPFFGQLILDCLNRTEKAMTQDHCFKAAEISMKAQSMADNNRAEISC
jgi:predicted dehydrogenase